MIKPANYRPRPQVDPATMPENWPGILRDATKRAVAEHDSRLALWICQQIRKWDLLIGQTPQRSQRLKRLDHCTYDNKCHWKGCDVWIRVGEPVYWNPDHGSYHVWHFETEAPEQALPFDGELHGR